MVPHPRLAYGALLLLSSSVVCVLVFQALLPLSSPRSGLGRPLFRLAVPDPPVAESGRRPALGLGIAARIYVLSLARRADRRRDMAALQRALGLQWTLVDAVDARDARVARIMARVRARRAGVEGSGTRSGAAANGEVDDGDGAFAWPRDIDALVRSDVALGLAGSDLWALSDAPADDDGPLLVQPALAEDDAVAAEPLTCATADADVPRYDAALPEHRLLTPGKVACWHSHLEVIRRIAARSAPDAGRGQGRRDEVAVVLEDDIDMERDIGERLAGVWDALPREWDIVFLGHCWSNESFHPSLPLPVLHSLHPHARGPSPFSTALHQSHAPKCTHAYALSTAGARRALLHLRHVPFAYSRALDQALAWLVRSGRLTAFSVVPPVVVQRKVGASDVSGGVGSTWREGLVDGVFGQEELRPREGERG